MAVRSEHPSLADFILESMSVEQRRHVGFVSFTHWPFALAALAETAVTLHEMGSQLTLAMWANESPMRDTGWSTNSGFARMVGSPSRDLNVKRALIAAGVPKGSFVRPPLRLRGTPAEARIDRDLNRSQIKALTYKGSPMGRAMLQIKPDTETPITDAYFWPKRLLQAAARSYAWAYDQTTALIAERSLTALVVCNGRFLHDRAVSAAGEAAGIKVMYYDGGGIDTDFDFTDNVTHDWSDLQRRMLKMFDEWPDEVAHEVGESWFQDRIAHTAPDNALFVESQASGTGIDRPEGQTLVVYFSSSGDEIAELELDWSRFIGDQPDALMGVLAHELGHVEHHHGMQMVVKTSMLSALVGAVIGDAGSFLTAIPMVLATQGYSRDAEHEADQAAALFLHRNGIHPRAMAVVFERMSAQDKDKTKGSGTSVQDILPIGLASHPSDAQRIAFFTNWQP